MANLVYVQLETLDDNPGAVGWYAYFDGEPDVDDLDRAFEDRGKVGPAALGWDEITYENARGEVPNPLSRHAGLRRWFVANAS